MFLDCTEFVTWCFLIELYFIFIWGEASSIKYTMKIPLGGEKSKPIVNVMNKLKI